MTRHRAERLPLHRGPAAWASILGPEPVRPPLEGTRTADFVVVGGGFAGLSAARRLTQLQPDAAIVLLEAGAIAEGAAGRNSGFMIDLPHELNSDHYAGGGDDTRITALNRKAISFAAEAVEEYDIPAAFFDQAGKVNGAATAKSDAHNVEYAGHLDRLGEAYELLDAQAMHALTGSRHFVSGLYTPGTVMLQPAGYVRGLAKGLDQNVSIHENSGVTEIRRTGGDWQVSTAKGQVSAARVILATNGHLESFGFMAGRLMHLCLFASMTPELSDEELERLGGAARWGITPSDPMGTTIRRIDTPQGGNRIVTRTFAALRSGMVARESDIATARRKHQEKFEQRFPQLRGMQMEYSWGGFLCMSLNGVAVMQELEPGLFAACVQNGLGTARGTLTGMGAAELACGAESDITRHFTSEAMPRKLPPRPIRDIGANIYLRWQERRAAQE